jgi:hypothetical protein
LKGRRRDACEFCNEYGSWRLCLSVSVLDVGRAGVVVEAGVSFDSYVRARSGGLMRLAWLITRDWDDAHDAVQDSFAALYPRWSRLPADADRREAYVSRCVVNACLAGSVAGEPIRWPTRRCWMRRR